MFFKKALIFYSNAILTSVLTEKCIKNKMKLNFTHEHKKLTSLMINKKLNKIIFRVSG